MTKEVQLTSKIMMIRPAAFGFNAETASTNAFQVNQPNTEQEIVRSKAQEEFDSLVNVLVVAGVQVIVYDDTPLPSKPDAVFPNNWITTHSDGSLITYPMFAPSRRAERREDVIGDLATKLIVQQRYSFESFEKEGLMLEGTGSMILDRVHHIVYACLSPRSHIELLEKFALLKQYRKIVFHATDPFGVPVYHTNVIMALGRKHALICLDCIVDEDERDQIITSLEKTNKEIIPISWEQVKQFAGNMLQLKNKDGQPLWVMSAAAHDSLSIDQKLALQTDGRMVYSPIPTIEKYGGGSVRCMLAELFLPEKK